MKLTDWIDNYFKGKNLEVRPYQVECWQRLIEARRTGQKRALVSLATGLGKTSVAAVDAMHYIHEEKPDARILFVSHVRDISAQARANFLRIEPSLKTIKTTRHRSIIDRRNNETGTATFTTFQALHKKLNKIPADYYDYIVWDESHHIEAKTFKEVRDHFTPHFELGLTATPNRADGLDILEYFGQPIYKKTFVEAMIEGWLVSVDYRLLFDESIKKAIDDGFGIGSWQDIKNLFAIKARNDVIAKNVTDERQAIGLDKAKTIVFCTTITHAEEMAKLLGGVTYHSDLKTNERNDILSGFRDGSINLITTVNTFNEGVDIPDARLLVFLRATSSRTIFEQQLGRGLRRAPGKDKVTVLDFAANIERLQYVHELGRNIGRTSSSQSGEYQSDVSNDPSSMFQVNVNDSDAPLSTFTFDSTAIDVLQRLKDNDAPPLPEGWYTQESAAKKLGVSQQSVRRMLVSAAISAPSHTYLGRVVKGISPDNLEKLRLKSEEIKSRMNRKYTAEDIIEHYKESKSAIVTGAHFGVSPTSIYKTLRKNNVQIESRKKTASSEDIISVYKKSRSIVATARVLDINRDTVSSVLKDAGIDLYSNVARPRKYDSVIVEAFHNNGMSLRATAVALGTTHYTVTKALDRVGYDRSTIRNRSGVTSEELSSAYGKYNGDIRLIVDDIGKPWTKVYKALDDYGYLDNREGPLTSAQAAAARYKFGTLTMAGKHLGVSGSLVSRLSTDALYIKKYNRKKARNDA